jgi:2-polyprenyl-6-methoxyphenol hydroxylase-like FAD-dependent oxidoreductase
VTSDLLIIGGGPAGGTTAFLAAKAGLSVTLCESYAVLPERVCGMYLCPAGVAMLERFGIHDRVAHGARRLVGMAMISPDLQRLETFFPQGDDIPDHGLALPRPQLDNTLLDLAREAGATIQMGARPVRIERAEEGWRATLATGEVLRSRLLVGADGRKSSVARLLGLWLPVRRSRTAIHIDRPSRFPAPPLGQMHVFDDSAYVGLNPVSPNLVNFSIVCDPDSLRGLPVVDFINDHIRRSPYLSELLEPMPGDAKPGATFPTNARVRRAATHDAALVGDASGYIDPLTGEGIYGAFWTSEELVRSLADGWSDLPSALQRYARLRAQRQFAKAALCELFQCFIRSPRLANSVNWLLSQHQAVADSFIGIVGNSYSPVRGLARIARHAIAF